MYLPKSTTFSPARTDFAVKLLSQLPPFPEVEVVSPCPRVWRQIDIFELQHWLICCRWYLIALPMWALTMASECLGVLWRGCMWVPYLPCIYKCVMLVGGPSAWYHFKHASAPCSPDWELTCCCSISFQDYALVGSMLPPQGLKYGLPLVPAIHCSMSLPPMTLCRMIPSKSSMMIYMLRPILPRCRTLPCVCCRSRPSLPPKCLLLMGPWAMICPSPLP